MSNLWDRFKNIKEEVKVKKEVKIDLERKNLEFQERKQSEELLKPKIIKRFHLKIPMEISEVLKNYIEENPLLGFKKVSRYILFILQNEVKKILDNMRE